MRAYKYNSAFQNNFLLGWFFNDLTLCDDIIDYFKNTSDKHEGYVYNEHGKKVVNKNTKDSIDSIIPNGELLTRYYAQLNDVMTEYTKRYPLCQYGEPINILQNPNIQYYPPGGAFKLWHSERLGGLEPAASRFLTFMTYLNDVTDEGYTDFYHQKLRVRPQKGLTVIWPVDWTYFHRGYPSKTQEKYIVTGWFNYVRQEGNKTFPDICEPNFLYK